jgi:hypothetical protein
MVATAWQRMLTASQQAFPDKFFNVALITTNGFPAFLPSGTPVYTPASAAQSASDTMVSALVNLAGQQLTGRLVVQANGLVGSGSPDPITITKAQAPGALLAWQSNEWELQTGGAACGGTREIPIACDEASFSAMLMTGIYPQGSGGTNPLKAQYLELFAPNIIAFPDAVLEAHSELLPGPTPVTTPTPTPIPTLKPTPGPTPTPAPVPAPTLKACPNTRPRPNPCSNARPRALK